LRNKALTFNNIEFQNVSYTYPCQTSTLGPFNFKVDSGELVGIIGPTGVGKSTLIDLLMGLLKPSSGEIFVNSKSLAWNYETQTADAAWTSAISHVPQRIYLLDGTIKENICLNSEDSSVDVERLIESIEVACLKTTLDALPLGWNTLVGEAGIRLSGGQRQRIAIARALYRGGGVMVLDEATSALDQQTEKEVMKGLRSIKNLTIISIAHRIVSLKDSDRIIRLSKNGSPLEVLKYEELRN
jgi:ATP-binding cassette subfamily B protein